MNLAAVKCITKKGVHMYGQLFGPLTADDRVQVLLCRGSRHHLGLADDQHANPQTHKKAKGQLHKEMGTQALQKSILDFASSIELYRALPRPLLKKTG